MNANRASHLSVLITLSVFRSAGLLLLLKCDSGKIKGISHGWSEAEPLVHNTQTFLNLEMGAGITVFEHRSSFTVRENILNKS